MRTRRFTVSAGFARSKNIPSIFVGIQMAESASGKAVYLYGRGSREPTGHCFRCGRELTHPVSILVGIGPECGQHWWDESVLGPYGMTEAHVEKLRQMVSGITIDGWFPKSVVVEVGDTEEVVTPPKSHPQSADANRTAKAKVKAVSRVGARQMRVRFENLSRDEFHSVLAAVKTLTGRRWDPASKTWICPVAIDSIKYLVKWGFDVEQSLLDEMESRKDLMLTLDSDVDIPMEVAPYPFQKVGIQFIGAAGGRALIGDDMGLGKTIQAIGFLALTPAARPAVVVCPASVKRNWAVEFGRCLPDLDVVVLDGRPKDPIAKLAKLMRPVDGNRHDCAIIINYDVVKAWLPALLALKPQTTIIDESHYVKTRNAQRTKAVIQLGKATPNAIGLSGTPIVNRPQEFFTILNLLAPEMFPSFFKFAHRYCGAHHNGFGWDFSGATNTAELFEKVNGTLMIRRLKSEVLTDLPEKVRCVIPVNDLKNRGEYNRAASDFMAWLANVDPEKVPAAERAKHLARINSLKQLVVEGKMASALNWIKDYLEVEDKLVVFCHHKSTVQALQAGLSEAGIKFTTIDGSTEAVARQKRKEDFQRCGRCGEGHERHINSSCAYVPEEGSPRVLIGTKAAKEGITLTAAHATCFLEFWWTPGDHDQAEDRVHRIGQVSDSVTAYYLVAENTIEVEIAALIDHKRSVVASVLDGKEVKDEAMFTALLKQLKGVSDV